MNGLKMTFGEQIEFYDLNIDDKRLDPLRRQFGITGRSQYYLLDQNGEIVRSWFGPLPSEGMDGQLAALLDELAAE